MFKIIENRVPISKIVAQQIEESIIRKSFVPGDKLPSEFELCKQFGVSRTAIREALQTLSAQNLINVVKGKGIFVSEISSSSVIEPFNKYIAQKLDHAYTLDLLHARQVIEPALAQAAALKRTDEDIDQLISVYNQLKNFKGNYQNLGLLDMQFHLCIASASHNQVLPVLLEPIIRSFMPEVKAFIYETVQDAFDSAQDSHKEIIDNIIEQKPEEARLAMVEHLKIAEDHTQRMLLAKYGELKETSL